MLEIAKESRPPAIVEAIGRVIKPVAGRLPLIHAIRGKVSNDPWVEQKFNRDPQTVCQTSGHLVIDAN